MASIAQLYSLLSPVGYAFIGLLGISFLIGFHELGHFLFCKLFNIHTPSFSIGFGPRLLTKKIGRTEFALSAIPLGGYVEIAGNAEIGQGEQQESISTAPDSFSSKPFYQKLLVMFGGILFNLAFAYLTITILVKSGMPQTPLLYPSNARPVINSIAPNSAADKAGLLPHDTIIAIDQTPINNDASKLLSTVASLAGKTSTVLIERNNSPLTISITFDELKTNAGKQGSLGATLEMYDLPQKPLINALMEGVSLANFYVYATAKGFVSMFRNKDTSGLVSPLGVISFTMKGAAAGFKIFLLLLAIISINLAILNLIPLPILDGGQIFFLIIDSFLSLFGRQFPARAKEWIHLISWAAILILTLGLVFREIKPTVVNLITKALGFFS